MDKDDHDVSRPSGARSITQSGLRPGLHAHYLLSLAARAERLRYAAAILRDDRGAARAEAEALAVLHSHQLRGTGTSFGFPEITELAGALEDASEADLPARLQQLVHLIEEILDTDAAPTPD